jgi:rhodanese-related sulfurtransferase
MSMRSAVSRVSMERMAEATVTEVRVPELPATFEDGNPILLDVREHDEWDRGHAPEAIHLPLMDALQALDPPDGTLPGIDKGADVYVICHAGGRSMKVAQAMLARGYQPRNVTGGMSSWAAAGRTVVDNGGKAGSV